MPKPIEEPTPQTEQDWLLLRQGIARLITHVAPTARVYERWPLKFDAGKTAELLRSPLDGNRIHAWIIGINAAIPREEKFGGAVIQWSLKVRIWGFLGYAYGVDENNPQNTIELEAKRLVHLLRVNRNHLTLDNTQALKRVGLLQFPDIDTQGFGSDDIIIAQGELNIELEEVLQ